MIFRQTAGTALLILAAGCAGPPARQADARQFVEVTLKPCDSALDMLAGQYEAGDAKRAASRVVVACRDAAGAIARADLPDAISEPCTAAGLDGEDAGGFAQTPGGFANSAGRFRYLDAMEAAGHSRERCGFALDA